MFKSGSSLLYGLTLFVSAFLLFWVEPLLGKQLLPVFGGTPAVWSVCMVFFQAALLAGYLYAHGQASLLKFRVGAVTHILLLLVGFFFLPRSLHEALGGGVPGPAAPVFQILRALSICIGLPFLFLSATSSLVQDWFGGSTHTQAGDPYFLYASSNLGSLLALLAYPWVIEPFFSVGEQWKLWRAGYLVMTALIALCAFWRDRRAVVLMIPTLEPPSLPPGPRLVQELRWMLWSFVPSSLLLGVTSYLSTDIVAVPLLWTIPLILYLGSFAYVFARTRNSSNLGGRLLKRGMCLGAVLCLIGIVVGFNHPAALFLPLHLAVFTIACLVCLGQVAMDRPASGDLTRYYLCLALGGVLGGVFNGILAPMLFNEISEYPVMIVVACLCRRPKSFNRGDWLWPLACALLIFVPYHAAEFLGVQSWLLIRLIVIGPAALACYASVRRPLRFGLGLLIFYFVGTAVFASQGQELLYRERSFFGTLKVLAKTQDKLIYLVHGSTSHGAQSTDPARSREPLTYYSRSGPAGQLFDELHKKPVSLAKIGIIGLGAGTLATYARRGEDWTFFELDPGVDKIARNPAYFTYLRDSEATELSVVLGDARIRIREVPDATLSLLVVDAFSSDSVPAHLMTREAQALYLSKLIPGGLLAFHVSNRFLRLAPVVGAVAAKLGAVAWVRSDLHGFGAEAKRVGESASIWVVVGRKDEDLGALRQDPRWTPLPANPRFAWSDDFYDLIGLIRW